MIDEAQDRQRWFKAWELLHKGTATDARKWLAEQQDEQYREDMRRRLNTIRENHRAGKWLK